VVAAYHQQNPQSHPAVKIQERRETVIGIFNRLPHVVCEVGTCFLRASHTEDVLVIPDDSSFKHERHAIDIVLCQRHDELFQINGLVGTITAHGDEVVGYEQ
jgi:hypothetical protein